MTRPAPVPFQRQLAPWPEQVDPRFAERVLELWDQGKDTLDIALALFNSRDREPSVAVALRCALQKRREQRRQDGG